MSNKLSHSHIPVTPSTTTKSIRFPNDMIEEVKKTVYRQNSNFSAFVVDAVRIALSDLKEEEIKGQED